MGGAENRAKGQPPPVLKPNRAPETTTVAGRPPSKPVNPNPAASDTPKPPKRLGKAIPMNLLASIRKGKTLKKAPTGIKRTFAQDKMGIMAAIRGHKASNLKK